MEISNPQGAPKVKIVHKASHGEARSRKIPQSTKLGKTVSSELSRSGDALLGRVSSGTPSQEDQRLSLEGMNLEVHIRDTVAFTFQSWDLGYKVLKLPYTPQ